MEKSIYIVLTQTSSVLSRIIKVFTRAQYNHSSISLSSRLEPMYSFGRLRPYNPFWGGYVKEYPTAGTFRRFPKTVAAVLELKVSEETYESIRNHLEKMYAEKDRYHYNFVGLCLAAFHVRYHPKDQYFCSELIRELFLKYGVPNAEMLPEVVEPSWFLSYPNTQLIYQGLMKEYHNVG